LYIFHIPLSQEVTNSEINGDRYQREIYTERVKLEVMPHACIVDVIVFSW
jgi:hypothetical protein